MCWEYIFINALLIEDFVKVLQIKFHTDYLKIRTLRCSENHKGVIGVYVIVIMAEIRLHSELQLILFFWLTSY